ncbi:MAG: Maf family protein [Promethearchaeota archaeon]
MMLEFIDYFILGSQSRDRREIMDDVGFTPFIVIPSKVNEDIDFTRPTRAVEILADRKAEAVLKIFRKELKKNNFLDSLQDEVRKKENANFILITADTVVVFKSETIGKASSEFEAYSILSRLQGNVHRLLTAFHVEYLQVNMATRVVNEIATVTGHTFTRVKFARMSDDDIKSYLSTGEWQGRAGCYAIQHAAGKYIKSIEGSYSGVIGLPVHEIAHNIKMMGLKI